MCIGIRLDIHVQPVSDQGTAKRWHFLHFLEEILEIPNTGSITVGCDDSCDHFRWLGTIMQQRQQTHRCMKRIGTNGCHQFQTRTSPAIFVIDSFGIGMGITNAHRGRLWMKKMVKEFLLHDTTNQNKVLNTLIGLPNFERLPVLNDHSNSNASHTIH